MINLFIFCSFCRILGVKIRHTIFQKCGRILWCFREYLAESLLLWDYRLEDILIRASYFLARIQIAL